MSETTSAAGEHSAAPAPSGHALRTFNDWPKVEVRESLIPGAGLGLFAREPLAAGEVACEYRGTVLSLMQCLKLTDRSYVRRPRGCSLSASPPPRSLLQADA